jgi:ABC-type branched-subunit amino acid transport system ATPase component
MSPTGTESPYALETRALSKSFGALPVARQISLALPVGCRHALIGPNGAGKTSLVNLVTGALKPSAGSVLLLGEDVTRLSQAARARRGLARTFQINQLFRGLSVLENLGLAIGERTGACNNMWRPAGAKPAIIDEAISLLDALALTEDALRPVKELSYGRQRLVEIAIALAQRPKLLLLDEPAAGVPSAESHLILDVLDGLDADISILIIEHDMDVVFRFARRITVLVAGAVLAEGTPEEIAADERVRTVYLGEAAHV